MVERKKTADGRETHEMQSLLARARRLADDGSRPQGRSESETETINVTSTLLEISENLTFLRRLLVSTRIVVGGLNSHVVTPAWNAIKPPILLVVRWYRALWNRCAYTVDMSTGQRRLSRSRSSVVVLSTVLFLSIFTGTQLGNAVRFVTVEPVIDGLMIALSKRTEVFYLSQSDEVDPENNIHSVRGCRKRGECAEGDAVYFRVQPRLAHDIWKLITYGNPVYVPDHIVAPIAPGLNECRVTYYGYRMTSSWIARILRSLQFYPTMLEANCSYISPR